MTVYVLNVGFDYEGEQTKGVFATEDAAIAAAQAENSRNDPEREPLKAFPKTCRHGEPIWARYEDDSSQFYIRPFEVK